MTRALAAALSILLAVTVQGASPIKVMLLDGESGGPWHKWQLTTPVLTKVLEETGLFEVDVVTAPPADGDFAAFGPKFEAYHAIVLNYDAPDDRWPDALKRASSRMSRMAAAWSSCTRLTTRFRDGRRTTR